MNNKWFLRISLTACLLAFFVIVLGAYVRLSDAGLGCPDWPGCFGQIGAPDEAHEIKQAVNLYPNIEVHSGKAWKEMIHRYFASGLGLLILIMAFLAWKHRHNENQQFRLPLLLVALVIFQGLLGMWTVTQLVRPTIVTLHLLTGLLTLSLLFWVFLKHSQPWINKIRSINSREKIKPLAKFAVLILALQIFLGGWTSTNYVALYCPDFPTCQGEWLPETNFSEAFVFFKDPTVNYEGGSLSLEAGVTVHLLHRIGAIITTITLSVLALLILFKTDNIILRKLAITLLVFLTVQVSLGIANVVLVLPIPIAVSHNAIAAVLLLTLLLLNYSLNLGSQKITPSNDSNKALS
ncbi:MAG: cytochrome B [endosymbiont of Galathealinum brachiosum]|uniref:Cytochrome B n=1 Tax=endosymbiont of Galathealinum brachiosum TaxID=2200906 RepID=A0A370DHL4_9GAMM|nr:MAG: cytochrome B [endosymbiont of Galathealinum brachiosum]